MVTLSLRRAAEADCRLLWEWANDPVVRGASFNSTTIPWTDHVAWFGEHVRSDRCFIYVVESRRTLPVGQVRFDLNDDGVAEVDVSMAAEWRGRGLAAEALRLACATFRLQCSGLIVAHIRPDNRISIRVFEKAGFHKVGFVQRGEHEAVRMELLLAGAANRL